MPRYSPRIGDRLLQGDRIVEVSLIDQISQSVTLASLQCRHTETLAKLELEERILTAELVPVTERDPKSADTLLDFAKPKDLIKARQRQEYVQALEASLREAREVVALDFLIAEIAAKIDDKSPPSGPTVLRWHRIWKAARGTLASLLPRTHRSGSKEPRISKEMQQLLTDFLDRHYLIPERPKLSKTIKLFEGYIRSLNVGRENTAQLTSPAPATIYRFVKKLDPYEVMLKRYGKRYADNHFRFVGAGIKVQAPHDLVQIDHTRLDIATLAPVKNLVARPWLTVALDTNSRMILGFYIGYIPPSYESVMLCLRNAILPKQAFLKHFTCISSTWPCHGLPRALLLDNGAEFHSESLKDACLSLGIDLIHHPAKQPHYKGHVERFFRTVNDGFLTDLRGKTFSNIQEKDEYDPVGQAAISFDVLLEAFTKWIVDIYPKSYHRGIDDFPMDVWQKGIAEFPVDLPECPEELLLLLNDKVDRTLTNSGIELHNTHYQSEELYKKYRRQGSTQKVVVKRDPTDLTHIYVYCELDRKFIQATAKDEMLHGLSLWQHRLVRKLINTRRKKGEEKYNVAEAIRELWQQINERTKSKKRRSNARIARNSEYGQKSPQEAPPPPIQPFSTSFSDLISHAMKNNWVESGNQNDGDPKDDR